VIALYHPGDSLLHRLPAGTKLMLLAASGLALFLTREPGWLALAAAAALALLVTTGTPRPEVVRQLRGPFLVIVAVAGVVALLDGAEPGLALALRLAALVMLGLAVTLTTRASALMAALERALMPLQRLGLVDAARVSLAVSLAVRFVPEILRQAAEIREAQAARGLQGHAIALVVPLLVRTLKGADEIAAAIDARAFPPPSPGDPTRPGESPPHDHS
jgi:biotin transport system permease protein